MPKGVYVRTEEMKVRRSAALKRKHADPDSVYNTMEYRAKKRACAIESWKKPEVRAKRITSIKEAHNKPESKAKQSAISKVKTKELWQDPEYWENHVIAIRIAHNKPESKAKQSAARKKYFAENPGITTREKNSNWKGGTSFLPYPFEFDGNLKNFIRTRDNYTCQLCGKTKREIGKNLCVHHINYDKGDLFDLNLILLCNSCNGKVNKNRDMWEDYFTYKLLNFCTKIGGEV